MSGKSAAVIALELYNEPRLAKRLSVLPVHRGVLPLIKIAAGDVEELLVFPPHIATKPEKARVIAEFYLQQVLFHPNSKGLRLLGLSSEASPIQLRDHKRWLLKWLHPDRNPNLWSQQHFKRLIETWESLQDNIRHEQEEVQNTVLSKHPIEKSTCPKNTKFTLKKQIHLRLNIWSRIKGRLRQLGGLTVIALAIYFISVKSDVISALTLGLPDIVSLFH